MPGMCLRCTGAEAESTDDTESILFLLALQQVFSGLKGALSWQANSKSTWTQTSRAVVTGRQGATSSNIAVAGVTDRWGKLGFPPPP